MSTDVKTLPRNQSIMTDDFFYFFLQLRKPRIRTVVERVRKLNPGMTTDQLAEQLIDSTANLSLVAGSLVGLPLMFPGVHVVLRYVGLVAGSTVITRMHLYLILEIALLYGKDIDDQARVYEMMAVVAATEAAVALPPIALQLLNVAPVVSIVTSGLTATTLTRTIGHYAKRFYQEQLSGNNADALPLAK